MSTWKDLTTPSWRTPWMRFPSFITTVISVEIVIGVAIALVLFAREI